MKSWILLFCLPALLCAEPLTLTIEFTNIQNTNAPLGILLFDQADGFPDDTTKAVRSIFSSEQTIQFENLKPSIYAVSVFQDLNGNRECDTNWLGIPTEPYGFSKIDNKPLFAPRFKHVRFSLDPDHTTLSIPLLH